MQPKYQADMRDPPEGREKPRTTIQDLPEKVESPEPHTPRRFQDLRLEAAKKALAERFKLDRPRTEEVHRSSGVLDLSEFDDIAKPNTLMGQLDAEQRRRYAARFKDED